MIFAFGRVILVATLCYAQSLYAADTKALAIELERNLVGNSFSLHQTYNVAAKQYFTTSQGEYLCRHKLTGIFPTRQELTEVTITRIRRDVETEVLSRSSKLDGPRMVTKETLKDYNFWVFTLKHPHLGKGEFRITTSKGELPDSLQEIKQVLGFVLTGHDLPSHDLFIASKKSALVHFVGSGHIPDAGECVSFATLNEATHAGFKECFLCFNRRLNLANLDLELQLGRETESTLRHYYQLTKDVKIQERVDRLGRKVLSNWPARLIGYDYKFNVVESQSFDAVACAGGYIFLHSGLIDLVESDQELEAVLAHEIAHVEQRHGIKQVMLARRQAGTTQAIGAIVSSAAVIAAAASRDKGTAIIAGDAASTLGMLIYTVGAQIAQSGYSREQETEADIFAMLYFN